jgi:pimeloyl-ACP methyl ester carboxylesterase
MSPILVLVPGSFGSSEMYDPVVLPLREKGYTIHVLDLLCYPGNYAKGKAPPSMYDDADAIREFVEKVADENGDDIVMMAHSYGGEFIIIFYCKMYWRHGRDWGKDEER